MIGGGSESVRQRVQQLEQGSVGSLFEANANIERGVASGVASEAQADCLRQASCTRQGVHVEVRKARNLPARAEVGSFVCVSVLCDNMHSQDLAELAIGLFPSANYADHQPSGRHDALCSLVILPLIHGGTMPCARLLIFAVTSDHNTSTKRPHTHYCKSLARLFILPSFRTSVAVQWPHPVFAQSAAIQDVNGAERQQIHGQNLVVFASAHSADSGDNNTTLGRVRIPLQANTVVEDWFKLSEDDNFELELRISYVSVCDDAPDYSCLSPTIPLISDVSSPSSSGAISDKTPITSPQKPADESNWQVVAPVDDDESLPSIDESKLPNGHQPTRPAQQQHGMDTQSLLCKLEFTEMQLLVTNEELASERFKRIQAEENCAKQLEELKVLSAKLKEATQELRELGRPDSQDRLIQEQQQLRLANTLAELLLTCPQQSTPRDTSLLQMQSHLYSLLTTRDNAARYASESAKQSLCESRQAVVALEQTLLQYGLYPEGSDDICELGDVTDVEHVDSTGSLSSRHAQQRYDGSTLYTSVRQMSRLPTHLAGILSGLSKIESDLRVISTIFRQADRSCTAAIACAVPSQLGQEGLARGGKMQASEVSSSSTTFGLNNGLEKGSWYDDAKQREHLLCKLDVALKEELAASGRPSVHASHSSAPLFAQLEDRRYPGTRGDVDSVRCVGMPAKGCEEDNKNKGQRQDNEIDPASRAARGLGNFEGRALTQTVSGRETRPVLPTAEKRNLATVFDTAARHCDRTEFFFGGPGRQKREACGARPLPRSLLSDSASQNAGLVREEPLDPSLSPASGGIGAGQFQYA